MDNFTALWLSINIAWILCVLAVSLLKSREEGDSCPRKEQIGGAVMAIVVPTVLWWFVYATMPPRTFN
jgi:hypothetical protein